MLKEFERSHFEKAYYSKKGLLVQVHLILKALVQQKECAHASASHHWKPTIVGTNLHRIAQEGLSLLGRDRRRMDVDRALTCSSDASKRGPRIGAENVSLRTFLHLVFMSCVFCFT